MLRRARMPRGHRKGAGSGGAAASERPAQLPLKDLTSDLSNAAARPPRPAKPAAAPPHRRASPPPPTEAGGALPGLADDRLPADASDQLPLTSGGGCSAGFAAFGNVLDDCLRWVLVLLRV